MKFNDQERQTLDRFPDYWPFVVQISLAAPVPATFGDRVLGHATIQRILRLYPRLIRFGDLDLPTELRGAEIHTALRVPRDFARVYREDDAETYSSFLQDAFALSAFLRVVWKRFTDTLGRPVYDPRLLTILPTEVPTSLQAVPAPNNCDSTADCGT